MLNYALVPAVTEPTNLYEHKYNDRIFAAIQSHLSQYKPGSPEISKDFKHFIPQGSFIQQYPITWHISSQPNLNIRVQHSLLHK